MPHSESVTLEKSAPHGSFLSLKDEDLLRLSAERLWSLSLEEMLAAQNYFRAEGREPTETELETIAQTWSEHCKHKTFQAEIDLTWTDENGNRQKKIYAGLLQDTIVRATRKLSRSHCLSVFADNAGIISFDRKWAVAFKVETHNHPSALEPYGGAGTGVGGVIRDILGAGLGAKPILNTDVFCVGNFSDGERNDSETLTPERVLSGIVAGVRDYGNRMGIPTANGAVLFHRGYRTNPLVFCGTVGLIPRAKIRKKVLPGDLIVSVGGKTGRDGIHGATFSSISLEKDISASVVQIGNAIVEKKAADAILRARDKNLYRSITDCGAGGYSSAVGELAAACGARVYLDKVSLKYAGLAPWEIWLSESQERMVLSVPNENLREFQKICRTEDADCSVIGEFTDNKRLTVFHEKEKVCELDLRFLHGGIPRLRRKATHISASAEPAQKTIEINEKSFGKILKTLLAHPNIASKKWIVRQYDHEVQGGTIIKPLVGANAEGPSDACVVRPLPDSWKGIAVSNGINPLFGQIDPYWMAANAIDESLRNLVAVGGNIEHCAILDNFCWGDINDSEVLGSLARCAQGCHDFAVGFGVPFISGKDSLNNTWKGTNGKLSSIPGTILISAVGIIADVRKCVTTDFKKNRNIIALLGETKNELGGSHLHDALGLSGGQVARVDANRSKRLMMLLQKAIKKGWVRSCHDLSEGGLAVALSEMCIGGNLGAEVELSPLVRNDLGRAEEIAPVLLFSESASRWLLEIEPETIGALEKLFSPLPFAVIGKVSAKPFLRVRLQRERKTLLKLGVPELKKNWNYFSNKQCL